MAAARADRGPAVRFVRARQVKSGVRGLLGQARYEVLVEPGSGRSPRAGTAGRGSTGGSPPPRRTPPPPPVTRPRRRRAEESGDTVADTLEALLAAAEDEERHQPHVIPDPDPVPASDPTIDDLLADMAARGDTPRPPSAGRVSGRAARPRRTHPDLDISDHEPSALEPDPVPLRPPQPAVLELEAGPARPRGRSSGRVTRAKLRALGIPTAILKRLPSEEPDTPDGWLDALHEVVSVVVPPPAEVSAAHPVVISGYGLPGVLAMLEAGAAGIPPGMLTVDGVTAPATAGRMIEVVRACVHS